MPPGSQQLPRLLEPALELVHDRFDAHVRGVDDSDAPPRIVCAPLAPARPLHAWIALLLDHERPKAGIARVAAHPFAPVHEVVEVVAEPRSPVVATAAHPREAR